MTISAQSRRPPEVETTRPQEVRRQPGEIKVPAVDARAVHHAEREERAVADDEVENLKGELNAILAFVEQLSEVDVEGVEPMTSVTPMAMKMRDDKVTDGGIPDAIIANAPAHEHHFFLVPKVVE